MKQCLLTSTMYHLYIFVYNVDRFGGRFLSVLFVQTDSVNLRITGEILIFQ